MVDLLSFFLSSYSLTNYTDFIHLFLIFCTTKRPLYYWKSCGRRPHPASGIRLGIFGNNTNADGIRLAGVAVQEKSCHSSFPFYRYSVSRSPYRTISWFSTWSQFRYLCVHFFVTFWLARYSIFSRDVSLGNTLFVLVTFRYCRFSSSMIFVVYMIRRISSGNWKKERTSSQLFSQLLIA